MGLLYLYTVASYWSFSYIENNDVYPRVKPHVLPSEELIRYEET
jgi:hypothetical protein